MANENAEMGATRAKRKDAGRKRVDWKQRCEDVATYCRINVELLTELMPEANDDVEAMQAESYQARIDVLMRVLKKLEVA
jgi:hypothetical protein